MEECDRAGVPTHSTPFSGPQGWWFEPNSRWTACLQGEQLVARASPCQYPLCDGLRSLGVDIRGMEHIDTRIGIRVRQNQKQKISNPRGVDPRTIACFLRS